MIQTIARQYGVHYTDDEVAALSFDEKSNWLKRNPVTAAKHFHSFLGFFYAVHSWNLEDTIIRNQAEENSKIELL